MKHTCQGSMCLEAANVQVRSGVVPSANLSRETYVKAIVPIGGLFAVTLWLSNAAYLYLSVSFIQVTQLAIGFMSHCEWGHPVNPRHMLLQMLKALMPVSVFTVGCLFGMETYSPKTLVNMIIITIGVVIASYGEINFVVIGVLLQLASVATESTRLMLIQILLQRRGLSLNPVTTMYYIAPASFVFLSIPFALVSRCLDPNNVNQQHCQPGKGQASMGTCCSWRCGQS